MKKFKTKHQYNYIKIILVIILFVLFLLLSFLKLNSSYPKLLSILTDDFAIDKDKTFLSISTNLDYLIKTYEFDEKRIIYNKEENIIYLYNSDNLEEYSDGTSIYDATKLLKNNLLKLGIDTIIEERKNSDYLYTELRKDEKNIVYYIDIHRNEDNNLPVIIGNKKYAQIRFVLNKSDPYYKEKEELLNKMNDYLNLKYPSISGGIIEENNNQILLENMLKIEIGNVENNVEEINNSTEILSLLLYYMIGD